MLIPRHSDGRVILKAAVLAILVSMPSFAAPPEGSSAGQPHADEYRISVDVGLVVLPVIVTDRKGRAVSGLNENSFHVFEDGRPQRIALFEPEDVPVTVGLVVDDSASTSARRPEVLAAAEEFAKASNPQDQIFVVNFNSNVSMGLPRDVPFTSDVEELQGAISRYPAAGNTALYDGLAAALEHLKAGTASRKALIVISDGADNFSSLTLQEVLRRAAVSNAEIYTLGVFDQGFARESASVLRKLAKITRGQAYFPQSATQISDVCQQIAHNLRHEYTIAFEPTDSNDGGKYHAVRVTAKAAGAGKLRVSTRTGYVAPAEAQITTPAPTQAAM
ncbi:MAG: VWA domain-containing protein [Terriglobia bacterium]